MYKYEEMREKVFTEEGFKKIKKLRKNMENREVLTVGEAIKGMLGDSYHSQAVVDYLVESGELKYLLQDGAKQYWVLKVIKH